MRLLTLIVFTVLSISSYAQTCYVDMVHTPTQRVVRSFVGYGDSHSCLEGMKECRKSIRLDYSNHPSYPNNSLDCVRSGSYRPNPNPNPYPPTNSCLGLRQGSQVYEISTGTYKTARILMIDCRNNFAQVEFYGRWSGIYNIDLRNLRPQNDPNNSCGGMFQGSDVYEISTGTYKTARILIIDCLNNYAQVEFYGRWSGIYDVQLFNLVPQR